MWKRSLDLAVSLAALAISAPLMLVAAAAILVESGRPVLFSQRRVGRYFRPFTLWKLRSMRGAAGLPLTSANDTRITRVGRILRQFKIDELPQFWNVLRGDMSLVGPRPEVPEYVALYRPRFEKILRVRPGITDPASIAWRDEEAFLAGSANPEKTYIEVVLPAKLKLAEEYVAGMSIRRDIGILLRTVPAVIRTGGGAARAAERMEG